MKTSVHTQRCLIPNAGSKEIPGADGGDLWKALHQALGLGALSYARRSNHDDARRSFDLFRRHHDPQTRKRLWG